MTCAQFLQRLDDGPPSREHPSWDAVVRHTWGCAGCRAELVAALVLAERMQAALRGLPGPPDAVRRTVLGLADGAAPETPLRPRARLARALPYLPPLLRLATDPLSLVPPWMPAPVALRAR